MPSVAASRPVLRTIYVLECGNSSFRVALLEPEGRACRGSCVVFASGHAASWDDPTPEMGLYDRVAECLAELGVATIRFDLPRRSDLGRPLSGDEAVLRTERFLRVLGEACLSSYLERSAWLAASLGGTSILELWARKASHPGAPRAVVFVGTVVEEEVQVPAGVESVELVHGEDDYLAYLDPSGSVTRPLSPREYGPESAQRLVWQIPGHEAGLHILPGLDHLLESSPGSLPSSDPAPFLASRIEAAFSPSSPSVRAS